MIIRTLFFMITLLSSLQLMQGYIYDLDDPFREPKVPLSCSADMFEYCYQIWIEDPDLKDCKPGKYIYYGVCQDTPCDLQDENCELILDPNGGAPTDSTNVPGRGDEGPDGPFSEIVQSIDKIGGIPSGNSTRVAKTGVYKCPPHAKNGEQFPDYNDCRYYFSCWSTKSERFDCGFAMHFANGECQEGMCEYKIPGSKPQEPSSNLNIGQTSPCIKGTFYCPVVPERGFKLYPDPNDCRYHYQCWSNGANRFDCGAENHFDNEAARCVPGKCPNAYIDCPPLKQGRDCETGVHICQTAGPEHDRNDCRYYFECEKAGDMAKRRKDCGEGRSFYLGKCYDEPCSYTLPDCPPLNAGDDNSGVCEKGSFTCPDGDKLGAKYPDPVNCRYYYECGSIGASRFDCGPTQHFDKVSSKCTEGFCPTGNPQCEPLQQTRKTMNGLRMCDKAGLVPDLNDCRYYFVCPGAGQYASELKDCGEGKSFQNGNCTDKPCSYALPNAKPQEPNDLSKCQKGIFNCPAGVGWGTPFPDPGNCRYYFECWKDGACLFDCGSGKHFDKDMSRCVEGNCPDVNPNCPPLEQGRKCLTGRFKCSMSGLKLEHDQNDCRYYFECPSPGQFSTKRHDCGEGKNFLNGACRNGPCTYALPNCPPQEAFDVNMCEKGTFTCPEGHGYIEKFPDPANCRYYYECWPLGACRGDCGPNKHFNKPSSSCIDGVCPNGHPDCPPFKQGRPCLTGRYKCSNPGNKLEHDQNDCRYYFECPVPGKYGTKRFDCGKGRHFLSGSCRNGTCPYALEDCPGPQEADDGSECEKGIFNCPAGAASGSKYPDTVNCRYYYECAPEGARRFDCGSGKHFDDGRKQCVDGICGSCSNPNCPPLTQGREALTGPHKCSKAGNEPDANDCRYYFRCLGAGVLASERLDCGVGKHFEGGKCVDKSCSYALEGSSPQDADDLSTCGDGTFECPVRPADSFKEFPDPNNCQYYYECWYNGARRIDCGPARHYDTNARKCVPGWCLSGNPNCPPLLQDRECEAGVKKCVGSGYENDLNDCRYYFECLGKGRLPMTRFDCGEGKHFGNGKCLDGPCTYALPNCPPQEPFDVNTCEKGTFNCPAGHKNIEKFPDPVNCRYYYECWEIGACRGDCGPNKHFSKPSSSCVAGICPNGNPDCPPFKQGRPCLTGLFRCSTIGLKLEHDQNDCRYYFECPAAGKYGKKRFDCGEGRHFLGGSCRNGTCPYALEDCNGPQDADDGSVNCQGGIFTCPEKPSSSFVAYPDPSNCRYYFQCWKNGARRFDCGPTKHFVREKGRQGCYDGECPTGNPNCPPLEQDRECVKGLRICLGKQTLEHDVNDCRYYFHCINAGQPPEERLDCGEGKSFTSAGKCVNQTCSYALPNCPPQNSWAQEPVRYLKDLRIVYANDKSEQPKEIVEDAVFGEHDINYKYGGQFAWLVPSWCKISGEGATSYEVLITDEDHPELLKLPRDGNNGNAYLVRKFDPDCSTRIRRLGLLRDPQPGDNRYSRRREYGWDECTQDLNDGRGGDLLHLCWNNFVPKELSPGKDITP